MNAKVRRVLNYFDTELEKYVIGDLLRLSQIRPEGKDGLQGCTVPQAMLIFATLDLLGYLINKDPKACKLRTYDNYKAIFSSTLYLFPLEYDKKKNNIVKIFRHGLIHQVFPKASAIAKHSIARPLISELPDGRPCLNVDRFCLDFINATRKLRACIKSGDHDELAEQMNDRLDQLAQEDYDELARVNNNKVPHAPKD